VVGRIEGLVNRPIRSDKIKVARGVGREYRAGLPVNLSGRSVKDLRRSNRGFTRGVIVGLVVGLICATAAGSWAVMGKSHWEEHNWHFQVGYLAGFLDVVRVVQARNPDTSLAREFKVPPQTPVYLWREKVNSLYADEANADRPLSQIIVMVGDELAAEKGYVWSPNGTSGLAGLYEFLIRRKQHLAEQHRNAEAEGALEGGTDATPGAVDGGGASE
jgi:hypothetical protein